MESGKADNSLNLAISLPEAERVSSAALSTGYDAATNRWELIVKYNGDLKKLAELLGFEAVLLINYYAIVTIAQEKIEEFLLQPEIEFAEKPNRLYFELEDSAAASCLPVYVRETNQSELWIRVLITPIRISGIPMGQRVLNCIGIRVQGKFIPGRRLTGHFAQEVCRNGFPLCLQRIFLDMAQQWQELRREMAGIAA